MGPSQHDIATRASILTLKALGKTNADITYVTGFNESTVRSILAKAIQRGFDPSIRPILILNSYVEDASRSGRPKKQTPEVQQRTITQVQTD